MEFIDLKAQQYRIRQQVDERIKTVLDHGQYILGPEVAELEAQLAAYVGVSHCISASSGTDALLIALMSLGIEPGDEVITSPFSFIATAEVIALLGAVPRFVDIDTKTFNMDPQLVEGEISPRTKAIIPVSLYGQCADFVSINLIAEKYGIAVIEDGAQSFGATYRGKQSCGLTMIGCTSFFPSKPLGCYGDGGACFTNDEYIANKMRQIRIHGQDKRYHHPVLGLNGRLDTIQAAILLAKLEIFPEEVEVRSQIGKRYTELLSDFVITPYVEPHATSVYAQYTVQVDKREQVRDFLTHRGIPSAVHYPIPLHLQPVFSELDCVEGSLTNAEYTAQRVLSLPMHPYLSSEDIDKVVVAMIEAIK